MPRPNDNIIDMNKNSLIEDEQRRVYQDITGVVNNTRPGFYFLYDFGGTRKTFLWSILGANIRSKGGIVLNVASSGIAALLLQRGRTAHSRFSIPIAVNEFTTCAISAGSQLAELIKGAKLITWDEAPIMNKQCFESLDRSLRDILRCDEVLGGKVVVLGGDFRQILPVITEGGRVYTILATIDSSCLWNSCKVLRLIKNMRLRKGVSKNDDLLKFSRWILDIGDGKVNEPNSGEVEIDIRDDLLIKGCQSPVEMIVREIYG